MYTFDLQRGTPSILWILNRSVFLVLIRHCVVWYRNIHTEYIPIGSSVQSLLLYPGQSPLLSSFVGMLDSQYPGTAFSRIVLHTVVLINAKQHLINLTMILFRHTINKPLRSLYYKHSKSLSLKSIPPTYSIEEERNPHYNPILSRPNRRDHWEQIPYHL